MKALKDIKNLITIHDGHITETSIQEQIEITDTKIVIKQASTVYLIYTGKVDSEITIEIKSSTLDMIESYQFEEDSSLIKNITIFDNCHITRYVDNAVDSNLKITIQDNVTVCKDASVTCAYVELSNGYMEATCMYQLVGQNASALVRLAALSKHEEQKHYTVSMQHLAPYTTGIMDNYGVVKEKGSLIIDGIGTIKKGNFQSNSHQTNKIIVFDQGCNAKANPYLYIDEFDVKASHGASVGKIDEDHLYYLQSRGLNHNEAMHLVTYGYFTPVLEFIKNEEVKEQFSNTLKEKVGI